MITLDSMATDPDYPVTLPAPGKPEPVHPILGPMPKAYAWLAKMRVYMGQGMSLTEADEAIRAIPSHDGKGRKHQPSHLR